ncbi:hypothetical protein [Myxococcus sp. CA040A]|uniref:hypothetical protein n=1 Tax=Myxococcus sp. CA040A TaxID=2741738 RepID=UPI00157AC769|nr:hypothetical protein [Myxococcus sp. CA040A]NTX07265.1 hypothetical protein [Myxococcus sp. CA040A]
MTSTCDFLSLVDRHFSGRGSPPDERRLRTHLPDCDRCREHYERRLLLARLDPRAPEAKTRLARGLGLDDPASPFPSRWPLLALVLGSDGAARRGPWLLVPVAMACLGLLVLGLPRVGTTGDDGFTARSVGTRGGDARLLAYAVEPGGHTSLLGPTLKPDQELAFAFRNPDGHRYLMVFARDAAGHVYWYHPSWTDPASDPSALPIPPGGDLRELPEAISHPLAPGLLTLHAVFLDSPLTVKQLEALLAAGPLESRLPAGADTTSMTLQVAP